MGSSVGAKKKIEEEKNAPPDANKDKSKSSIIKDISKENESQKENPRTQSKIIDSKNTKSDKITNPIINKNNLNPGKDSSLSKIINENEKVSSYKRSKANSQYLPSEIKGDIAIEKEKSVKESKFKEQDKKNKDKNKDKEKEKKEENDLLSNEKFIEKDEQKLFIKTMTENQIKNLENYNRYYRNRGEHIFISLGETFGILNNFYRIYQLNINYTKKNLFIILDCKTSNVKQKKKAQPLGPRHIVKKTLLLHIILLTKLSNRCKLNLLSNISIKRRYSYG